MPAFAITAMLLWPWLDSELLQNAVAGIVLVIVVVASIRLVASRKLTAIVLPMLCAVALAFALTARHEVVEASDDYANGFIKRHSCRPTFAGLSAANEGWERGRGLMLLEIRKFGAVRRISYQENGFLRFGFLYDDSRSVWLPECAAA